MSREEEKVIGQNNRSWVGAVVLLVGLGGIGDRAIAAPLENWRFDPNTNQLELSLDADVVPSYYLETDPPRITIDLPNTELGTVSTQQEYSGAIRRILLSQPGSSDATRITIELAPEIALSPQQVQLQKFRTPSGTNRWVLYPSIVQTATVPTPAPSRPAVQPSPPPTSPPPSAPSAGTRTPQIQFGQPLPKSP